jgi:uncharacterized protein YjbI with pentapeptide repeats
MTRRYLRSSGGHQSETLSPEAKRLGRRPDHDIGEEVSRAREDRVVDSSERAPTARLELDDDGEAHEIRVVDARHAGDAFARARLVDVDLIRCDLSGCDFSESTWQWVRLVECRASGIDLAQAKLERVTFVDCKLDDASFRLGRLRTVRFDGSVLSGAEFVGAQFEEVAFDCADLAGADFTQARCSGVDLRGARLDEMRGIGSLGGATVGFDQLVGLAPALAQALGLKIAADDASEGP